MAKRYYMTLAGVKCEISEARAAQIRRLQALIRAQRATDSANVPANVPAEDSAATIPADADTKTGDGGSVSSGAQTPN